MSFSPTNLLLSLGNAMAQAAPGSPGIALGENLFVHQLPASASNLPGPGAAAVLRIYGGPVEGELRPVPVVSVQCMTYASDPSTGLLFAWWLYDALHDDTPGSAGRPRQTWSITGKKLDPESGDVVDDDVVSNWDIRLIVLGSGPPGIIGRGDAASGGRYEISFNFDVRSTSP